MIAGGENCVDSASDREYNNYLLSYIYLKGVNLNGRMFDDNFGVRCSLNGPSILQK